jgi:ferric-dicitrate binding protein FerR (iron transport regulator)
MSAQDAAVARDRELAEAYARLERYNRAIIEIVERYEGGGIGDGADDR